MEKDNISLQHKLDNFLFVYRNSVHSTTNQTPAMLFLGRMLRSHIDLLKPNLRKEVQNKQFSQLAGKTARDFEIGQEVLARDYGRDKWAPGKITTRTGPLMYTVDVGDQLWRCHVDQLLDAQPKTNTSSSPDTTFDDSNVSPVTTSAEAETLAPDKSSATPTTTAQVQRHYPERHRVPPQRLDL